jgi:hypothetical protein
MAGMRLTMRYAVLGCHAASKIGDEVKEMTNLIARLFGIVALCTASVGLADAYSLRSPEGSFTAEFPEEPKLAKSNANTGGGIAYEQYLWSVDQGSTWYGIFMSIYSQPVQKEYDGPTKGSVDAVKGKLISQQPFELGGMTGREIFIDASGQAVRQRLLWVGDRFYQFVFVGPPGTEKAADSETFMNSVQFDK